MPVLRKMLFRLALVAVLLGLGYGFLVFNAPTGPSGPAATGTGAAPETEAAAGPGGAERRPAREVSFGEIVPFEALLGPAELPPEDIYRDLYAAARAPARAQGECASVLDAFAATCQVRAAEIRRLDDGRYRIEARLAFLPAELPAGLPQADPQSVSVTLGEGGGTEGIAPADLPAARARLYRLAREACAELRASAGACVIESVEISLRDSPAAPGAFDISATARLDTR